MLRLVGCFVGVIALLKLAITGLNVQLQPFFVDFVERCRGWTETLVLLPILDPVAHWIVERLRELKVAVPDLQPHWRSIFTLQWLLLAAVARNFPGYASFKFIWAAVSALAVAVAVGTQPLQSIAVFAWPFAGFLLFMFFLMVTIEREGGLPSGIPMPYRNTAFWLAILLVALGLLGDDPLDSFFGTPVDSPGMLFWACLVAAIGTWFVVSGLSQRGNPSAVTATGIDIVGTMGIALSLTLVFHA